MRTSRAQAPRRRANTSAAGTSAPRSAPSIRERSSARCLGVRFHASSSTGASSRSQASRASTSSCPRIRGAGRSTRAASSPCTGRCRGSGARADERARGRPPLDTARDRIRPDGSCGVRLRKPTMTHASSFGTPRHICGRASAGVSRASRAGTFVACAAAHDEDLWGPHDARPRNVGGVRRRHERQLPDDAAVHMLRLAGRRGGPHDCAREHRRAGERRGERLLARREPRRAALGARRGRGVAALGDALTSRRGGAVRTPLRERGLSGVLPGRGRHERLRRGSPQRLRGAQGGRGHPNARDLRQRGRLRPRSRDHGRSFALLDCRRLRHAGRAADALRAHHEARLAGRRGGRARVSPPPSRWRRHPSSRPTPRTSTGSRAGSTPRRWREVRRRP